MEAVGERLFEMRLARSRDDLFGMLERVYGRRADYAEFRDALLTSLRAGWDARPEDLRWLDLQRDLEPDWFQRSDRVGYVFYVDRFNGDLRGVLDRLDWLESLGVTYVHLMPFLLARPGDDDGGYSVMDYRAVDPRFGSWDDLVEVASELRRRGMNLCVDLVLNHTAKEHEWARKAWDGDPRYRAYYRMFDDPAVPAAFEETLVEVFPDQAPGSFTHYPEIDRWVWTTFNEHQWDLDWSNPWVFLEMVEIALHLANTGADILRLDAVAFMWKRMGTRCQSEPEVHDLLHAFRAATRISASAVIHLEEAIVGPAEMIPYLGAGEHTGKAGNLAYHNSLMVQFWSALATRDTTLMSHVLRTHFPPSLPNATYATYVRCHDDIGWAIDDGDAAAVGLSGRLHREFLADWYTGGFPTSFARGTPFQVNPETGDARTNGTTASLAGLEDAIERADLAAVDLAIERVLLGHALIASYGGIPLIYMGDEIALLNDHTRLDGNPDDPAVDGRWIHRPEMDWERAAHADHGFGPEGRVLAGLRHVMARRAATPELHGAIPIEILDHPDRRIFSFARQTVTDTIVCIFNFSPDAVHVEAPWLAEHGVVDFHDCLADDGVDVVDGAIVLPGYGRRWLR